MFGKRKKQNQKDDGMSDSPYREIFGHEPYVKKIDPLESMSHSEKREYWRKENEHLPILEKAYPKHPTKGGSGELARDLKPLLMDGNLEEIEKILTTLIQRERFSLYWGLLQGEFLNDPKLIASEIDRYCKELVDLGFKLDALTTTFSIINDWTVGFGGCTDYKYSKGNVSLVYGHHGDMNLPFSKSFALEGPQKELYIRSGELGWLIEDYFSQEDIYSADKIYQQHTAFQGQLCDLLIIIRLAKLIRESIKLCKGLHVPVIVEEHDYGSSFRYNSATDQTLVNV